VTPSVRVLASVREVPAAAWDALVAGDSPFLEWQWLAALEEGQSVGERTGWLPQHLTLWEGDRLLGACPLYVKGNSHGEFVFDHAWAHAYARYGQSYFPKWLCAVPYTPVTGPRVLARDPAARSGLVRLMEALVANSDLSSAHVNFVEPVEDGQTTQRFGVQSV